MDWVERIAIEGGYQNQPIMLQGNIFNDNSGHSLRTPILDLPHQPSPDR